MAGSGFFFWRVFFLAGLWNVPLKAIKTPYTRELKENKISRYKLPILIG